MNNARKGFLLISLLLIRCLASAQLPDRVTATQSFLDTIRINYADENSFSFDLNSPDPAVNIPIRINIIMNKDGSAGVDQKDIEYSLDLANGYFKNAGIQFFIDTVEYIDDYNYSFITYNNLKKELLTKYAVNDRINLFLADSIKLGSDYSYGFTYFPDVIDSNFIWDCFRRMKLPVDGNWQVKKTVRQAVILFAILMLILIFSTRLLTAVNTLAP
jgi:hypothetical protein